MPRSTGERGEPRSSTLATSTAVQNITVVSEVIEYEADLGWFYASLPATFYNSPLVIHDLADLFRIEFLKHQWLLLLIRHLLQMVSKWLVLGIEKNTWTEDPYTCKHALIVLET